MINGFDVPTIHNLDETHATRAKWLIALRAYTVAYVAPIDVWVGQLLDCIPIHVRVPLSSAEQTEGKRSYASYQPPSVVAGAID